MKSKRYMKNQFGVLSALCGLIALAAQWLLGASSTCIAANAVIDSSVDTHCHSISRTNDAAITTRHLLYKEGAVPGSGAAVCGANTLPLGTIDNTEASTGVAQTVNLLGKERTVKMVASAAMSIGAWAYTAASGKVQGTPTTAGAYFKVGRLLTASGADGDVIEVESIVPQPVTAVANAASLATTQAAMLDGAIVIVLGA